MTWNQTYDGSDATLDVDVARSDDTKLAISVYGTGQVPTAELSFDQVGALYKHLGDWLIATRPKLPLNRDDEWDGRDMPSGTILRRRDGHDVLVKFGPHWGVVGSKTYLETPNDHLGVFVVAYVPPA